MTEQATKSFLEQLVSSAWTSLAFNIISLGFTLYTVKITQGARRAAESAVERLKSLNQSIDAATMVSDMEALKTHLLDRNYQPARPICDKLRTQCVKIKDNEKLIRDIRLTDSEIANLVAFFASLERSIVEQSVVLNIDSFNKSQDLITRISNRVKEINNA